jgi:hypothetical protein
MRLSAKSVIPECYIDSNLFDVLLNFEKESVNHTKGNGTVVVKMENKFSQLCCLGIIDKDKRELSQIKRDFDNLEIGEVDEYFILFKNKNKSHYLIQIVPEIETWIINIVNRLEIKLDTFGINASNAKELATITKRVDKKNDPKFKILFKEIVRISKEKQFLPVLKLIKISEMILNKNYNLDLNELKNV